MNQNRDILKWVVVGLACFGAAVLIFGAGVFVGGTKAKFSYRWAESYHKNFGGPKEGFLDGLRKFPAGDFIDGYGSFGEIIEIKDNSIIIRGQENIEKLVAINQNTAIVKGREIVKDGVKVGDNVVVIGSPNEDGQIEAKLIRIFGEDEPELPYKRPRPIPFL